MANKKSFSREIQSHLFSSGIKIYAILDGASMPGLLERLYNWEPEFVCLYSGDLSIDLAEAAPYLVRLEFNTKFTNWVIGDGWGNHRGIFAAADADLQTIQEHFSNFIMVEDPDGKAIYFRFYDPRVLRVYLPTCISEEINFLYGPVTYYALEGKDSNTMLYFWPGKETVRIEEVGLNKC